MILTLLACSEPPAPPQPMPPAVEPAPAPVVQEMLAPPPAPKRPVPPGWVDLATLPGLHLDIRYASSDNFTGAPLPGYAEPRAWLTSEAAEALQRVQASVAEEGLALLVYDAYRPARASAAMVSWTERTQQEHLLTDGYIAARSGHNKGATIDLTLVDDRGTPLDMGTPWDTFSTASHTINATGTALENRRRLQHAMVAAGWKPYSKEWWHFRYPQKGLVALDVPYGCTEEPVCE